MVEYQYTDKTISPNLDQIHLDIAASTMTDKSVNYCRWDENDALLRIFFDNALSEDDKTALDTIVTNNS